MSRRQKLTRAFPLAFTLTEILIVLGVIAALAALALPVFSRVRERSYRNTCQSNLKQLALATQQYVQDHDGRFPGAGLIGTDQRQWAGRIFAYIRDRQAFVCPTRSRLGHLSDLNVNATLHYGYNVLRLNTFPRRGRRFALLSGQSETTIAQPSKVWLHDDGDWDGPHSYPDGPSACGDWWRPRWGQEFHSGGANYSFVDGHVTWLNPRQIEEIECALGAPPFRQP